MRQLLSLPVNGRPSKSDLAFVHAFFTSLDTSGPQTFAAGGSGGVGVGVGVGGGAAGRLMVARRLGASVAPASSLSPCANRTIFPAGTPGEPSLGFSNSAAIASARRHDRCQLYSHWYSALANPSTRTFPEPPALCQDFAAASISAFALGHLLDEGRALSTSAESTGKTNVSAPPATGSLVGEQSISFGAGQTLGFATALVPPGDAVAGSVAGSGAGDDDGPAA